MFLQFISSLNNLFIINFLISMEEKCWPKNVRGKSIKHVKRLGVIVFLLYEYSLNSKDGVQYFV